MHLLGILGCMETATAATCQVELPSERVCAGKGTPGDGFPSALSRSIALQSCRAGDVAGRVYTHTLCSITLRAGCCVLAQFEQLVASAGPPLQLGTGWFDDCGTRAMDGRSVQ